MWPPSSLRMRLALWYLLVLGVTLALFSTMIFVDVRRSLLDGVDSALVARAQTVLSQLEIGPYGVRSSPDFDAPRAEAEIAVYLFDTRGRLVDKVAGSHALPPHAELLRAPLHGRAGFATVGDLRLYALSVWNHGRVYGVVQVVQSLDGVTAQINRLLLLLLLSAPGLLLLATLGGYLLAGRTLAPIARITRTAEAISGGNLKRRLGLAPRPDEVGRLAATLDRMLERLDQAFAQQRQFVADASHELRTPLTIIKGDLDVLLRRRRTPEEYEEVARGIGEEVTRLSQLVEDLLTLARTDSGQAELACEFIYLDRIVEDAVAGICRMAAAQHLSVTTHLSHDIAIIGDPARLRQLLLNLLGNAVTYTPAGGEVRVALRPEGHWACLEVADNGIGIAAADLPYIFDHFYRADKARARDAGGIGLGLAIARWCVEAHGGRIGVASHPGAGTTFSVWLPLALSDDSDQPPAVSDQPPGSAARTLLSSSYAQPHEKLTTDR